MTKASEVHPALYSLVMLLPPPGSYWPMKEQEKWFTAFRAVVLLLYEKELPYLTD